MESSAASDGESTAQGGVSSGSEATAGRKRPQTVSCFLCGGTQIYPGPRYENHLINEHGVLDIEFMIAISLFKQKHGNNPSLEDPGARQKSGPEDNELKGKLFTDILLVHRDIAVELLAGSFMFTHLTFFFSNS